MNLCKGWWSRRRCCCSLRHAVALIDILGYCISRSLRLVSTDERYLLPAACMTVIIHTEEYLLLNACARSVFHNASSPQELLNASAGFSVNVMLARVFAMMLYACYFFFHVSAIHFWICVCPHVSSTSYCSMLGLQVRVFYCACTYIVHNIVFVLFLFSNCLQCSLLLSMERFRVMVVSFCAEQLI